MFKSFFTLILNCHFSRSEKSGCRRFKISPLSVEVFLEKLQPISRNDKEHDKNRVKNTEQNQPKFNTPPICQLNSRLKFFFKKFLAVNNSVKVQSTADLRFVLQTTSPKN